MACLFPARAGVIAWQAAAGRGATSFPRTRGGDPRLQLVPDEFGQLFPARAGVIPVSSAAKAATPSFPRTRGGDPAPISNSASCISFSPHARG